METISQKATSVKTEELKDVVSMLKNVFGDLNKQAALSEFLLGINIQDAFSKTVSDIMDKPLSSNYDALKGIETAIKELLNEGVKEFLVSNKRIIDRVYLLRNRGTVLHYTIILKDYNIHKRARLYKYINEYKNSEISNRFPIIFQSIPKDLIETFEKEVSEDKYETIPL